MSETTYSININQKGEGAVTVVESGRVQTFTSIDPNFPHILAACKRGLPLDDVIAYRIPTTIERFSERVAVEDDRLFFDDRLVEGEIADTVMRYHEEGRDFSPIVKFLENLSDNVTPRSREQLFTWLTAQDLEIDPDGLVIGYRGLRSDMHSDHAGGANVLTAEDRANGVEEPGEWVEGHIPNQIGSIISMPREMVDDDQNRDCSNGLHIGSERYARGWSSNVTVVCRFHPADVVSVPHAGVEKVRVCRYEILGHIDEDDHETPADPDAAHEVAVGLEPEATDAILDEVIPEDFRKKMGTTGRWVGRLRRRNKGN